MEGDFRVGECHVSPRLNAVVRSGKTLHVEPKVMGVLVYLAGRPGEVVSKDDLLKAIWGETFVSESALTRCVAELRKVFDDDVREPHVIQTIAKSGYRLIAEVRENAETEASSDGDSVQAVQPAASPSRAAWRGIALLATGGLVGSAMGGLVIWSLKPTPSPASRPVTRFNVSIPADQQLAGWNHPAVALSPDDTRIVYVASYQSGLSQLYVRPIDSLEATPVPGTQGAFHPFFSPDGESVGFFAGGKLKKVSLQGGSPVVLCDAPDPAGATWAPDDTILFAPGWDTGLVRVPAAGGTPRVVTTPERSKGEAGHMWPQVLPGGKAIVFTVGLVGSAQEHNQVAVRNLETGRQSIVIDDATSGRYVASRTRPSSAGHLVYARAPAMLGSGAKPGTLLSVLFDVESLEASSASPVPVAEAVMVAGLGAAQFSISPAGSLVYVHGASEDRLPKRLEWVDRRGTTESLPVPSRDYHHPAISPDGRRIAVGILPDIWVHDLDRGTLNRLTLEHKNYWPIWSRDGSRVVYSSDRDGPMNLFWIKADGSGGEERLTRGDQNQSAGSFSPDGKWLVYYEYPIDSKGRRDIWVLPLDGERKPRRLLDARFNEVAPALSPDGRWLSYASDESGRYEIYVQPFPGLGKKWPITSDGARESLWARSGKELFYRSGDGMYAVDVTSPGFAAGKPRLVFEGKYRHGGRAAFDVAPDGRRFLMVPRPDLSPVQIHVVLDWIEELQARTRAAKR